MAAASSISRLILSPIALPSCALASCILALDFPRDAAAFQNAYLTESVTKFPRKFRGENKSCAAIVPAPMVGSSW
jgi:hypothetical protein